MKKIGLILAMALMFLLDASAQNGVVSLEKVIPLSPNASAIQRFGNIPVGYTTGTADISIPLFELQSGQLKVPVSISYHNGGVRMNDQGSDTGLGWALSAGGVISRSMMGGQPDDRVDQGYWYAYPVNLYSDPYLQYAQMHKYADGIFDTQPDVFSYNFSSYSGKFLFDNQRNVSGIPYTNLKITPNIVPGSGISAYTILTPDGTQYFFNERENSDNRAWVYDKDHDFNPLSMDASVETIQKNSYFNSWYLSQIISADKKDTIKFEYNTYEVTYSSPGASTYKYAIQTDANMSQQLPGRYDMRTVMKNKLFAKKISKITTRNGFLQFYGTTMRKDLAGDKRLDSVVLYTNSGKRVKGYTLGYSYLDGTSFFADAQVPGDPPDNLRLFLTSVQEVGAGKSLPPYLFDYEHSIALPAKNISGGDYWGFANGKTWKYIGDSLTIAPGLPSQIYDNLTSSIIDRVKQPNFAYAKQGILTKIQYPTGGYSTFDYEPHKGIGSVVNVPVTTCDGNLSFTISNQDFINNAIIGKIKITNGTSDLSPLINYMLMGNYQQYPIAYEVEIRDSATNQLQFTFRNKPTEGTANGGIYNPTPTPQYKRSLTFLPGKTYLIKARNNGYIYPSSDPDLAFATISVPSFNCATTYVPRTDSLIVGGVRVKRITDFSAPNGKATVKEYEYADPFRPLLTGNYINELFYEFDTMSSPDHVSDPPNGNGWFFSYEKEKTLSAMSSYQLADLNGPCLKYGTVKEKQIDFNTQKINGYTSYNFDVVMDGQDGGYNMPPYPPFVDNTWASGTLINKTEWKVDNSGFKPVSSHDYVYSGIKDKKSIYGEAYINTHLVLPPTAPWFLLQNNYSEYAIQRYVTHRAFHYTSNYHTLDSEITKTYTDSGDTIVTTKNYTYDSSTLLPKKIETTNSNKDKTVQSIIYPSDLQNLTATDTLTLGIKALQNSNVLNAEIEKTTYKSNPDGTNNRFVSSIMTYYKPDVVLPGGIKVVEASPPPVNFVPVNVQNGAVSVDPLNQLRVKFDKYDSYGHLIQQHLEKGMFMSYIWSYNGQYPIAEIKNADYATVQTILGASALLSFNLKTNPTDIEIKTFLTPLRTNLPNAEIVTYTYIPLIGMTSSTDAKGQTTYYECDEFQRLKNIKDRNGDIIKNYTYYYQP
ncbi:hypothetical protein [Pedobacter nutrimenti]|uniref:hypothetical protein n=1 Tax=Pedobacter nutrimenti TaxID=1241337 RepID=UPI00292D9C7B|nr:hypothetical protein [Pedobacter nutrimenti]